MYAFTYALQGSDEYGNLGEIVLIQNSDILPIRYPPPAESTATNRRLRSQR
jgi:hypothetical protein